MSTILLVITAFLLVLTGIGHSVLGELRLLRPLFQQRIGIVSSRLARFLLRLAWHFLSLAWLLLAIVLLTLRFQPEHALQNILVSVGLVFTIVGIFDAIGSKGRHVGWPALTGIGLASLLAAMTGI